MRSDVRSHLHDTTNILNGIFFFNYWIILQLWMKFIDKFIKLYIDSWLVDY